MKKFIFKSWLVVVSLLVAGGFAACSDDDDKAATPVFPKKQTFACEAGDTREFTFDANMNWSLASSAIWCQLSQGDGDDFVLSGVAGTQTVTVKVTDDAHGNELSVAKLELTMGGQKVVIGEVQRSAKGYELKVYDEDGVTELTQLTVGYNSYEKFVVKSNYRFAVTNLPGWVQLEGGALVGGTDEAVTGGLQVITNGTVEKYPVEASPANVVTFASEDGKASLTVPVVYAGMPAKDLSFEGPTSNVWGWTASLDGKTYTQGGTSAAGTSSGTITYRNRVPFTVKALNDDYAVVLMEKYSLNGEERIGLMYEGTEWITYTKGEGGQLTVSVEPGTSERTGYVLALPRAEYEEIEQNLENSLLDETYNILYRYEQNNLLIELTQKGEEQTAANPFKVLLGGMETTEFGVSTDSNIKDWAMGAFNGYEGNVYELVVTEQDKNKWITIYCSDSNWDLSAGAGALIQGAEPTDQELGQDENGYNIGFTIPEALAPEMPVLVGFYDPSWTFVQVFAITIK